MCWMTDDYTKLFNGKLPEEIAIMIKEYNNIPVVRYNGIGTKYSAYEHFKGIVKNKNYYLRESLAKKIETRACQIYDELEIAGAI